MLRSTSHLRFKLKFQNVLTVKSNQRINWFPKHSVVTTFWSPGNILLLPYPPTPHPYPHPPPYPKTLRTPYPLLKSNEDTVQQNWKRGSPYSKHGLEHPPVRKFFNCSCHDNKGRGSCLTTLALPLRVSPTTRELPSNFRHHLSLKTGVQDFLQLIAHILFLNITKIFTPLRTGQCWSDFTMSQPPCLSHM